MAKPVCEDCKKKAVKGKARRCAACKHERRKATWRASSKNYYNKRMVTSTKPAKNHRLVQKEKPTLWALSHPKEAIKLAKAAGDSALAEQIAREAKKLAPKLEKLTKAA